MATSAEQKFNAAVKVIRGLPKNGSFQPSYDLMLKFYAYYKQATEGPCTVPKPSLWSVVNRRKWDAWAELGDMERERAMMLYVEELKNVSKHVRDTLYPPEIVETMPQTEQVAEFVETLGSFYELIEDGKEETTLDVKTGLARGSLQFNGGGDLSLDHSAVIGELMKINNNDTKTNDGPVADSDRGIISGQASNGIVDNLGSDEEDEEEDGNEAEVAERMGMMTRIESGSDTDEFCDTSDQMVQIPVKVYRLHESLTSTPVDGKRETRVRFALNLHTNMGSDERASVSSNSSDLSEMMASRLALGTATGLSFLPPQSSAFAPHKLTESLCVNNSFSSLVSLAGNDSVAGDLINDDNDNSMEDDTTLDDGSMSFNPSRDLLTSRGGGVEGGPGQGDQSSQVDRVGTATGFAGRGRDRRAEDDSRHVPILPGSSGGGESPGGAGRQPYGHLDEQILLTLIRLQQDMADISNRLASLELIVKLQREEHTKKAVKYSKWWPFTGMSRTMVFLLIVWPFFAPFLMNVLCRRRSSHR